MQAARNTLAAYVLAIESIAERMSDAGDLVASLRSLGVADEVAIAPAIYWQDEEAILDYLSRFPEHTFAPGYLAKMLAGMSTLSKPDLR